MPLFGCDKVIYIISEFNFNSQWKFFYVLILCIHLGLAVHLILMQKFPKFITFMSEASSLSDLTDNYAEKTLSKS